MSEERRNCKETLYYDECGCRRTNVQECDCHNEEQNVSCGCQTKQKDYRKRQNTDNSERTQKLTEETSENNGYTSDIRTEELREIYKNANLGMESIEILRPLSADRGFRNLLLKQYNSYSIIAKKMELYAEEHNVDLETPSMFSKGMMYLTTMVNTLKDKSNSKLAEIMIQGINMGIISLTKIINGLSDEGKANGYAEEMLNLLQKNLEEMKLFL